MNTVLNPQKIPVPPALGGLPHLLRTLAAFTGLWLVTVSGKLSADMRTPAGKHGEEQLAENDSQLASQNTNEQKTAWPGYSYGSQEDKRFLDALTHQLIRESQQEELSATFEAASWDQFLHTLVWMQGEHPQLKNLQVVLEQAPPAHELAVDEAENLYLADGPNRTVLKCLGENLYTNCLELVGGQADQNPLLEPSHLQPTSRMELYVLDEHERKLNVYATNLQFLRSLNFLDLQAEQAGFDQPAQIYPTDFAISPTGELYVLDAQSGGLHHFDQFWRYQGRLGDPGLGVLQQAEYLTAANDQQLLVTQPQLGEVQVFSPNGARLASWSLPAAGQWLPVKTLGPYWFAVQNNTLWTYRLDNGQALQEPLELPFPIQAYAPSPNGVYLLCQNTVYLYSAQQKPHAGKTD